MVLALFTVGNMYASRPVRCLRCLLLVMCTHPFAKEALTLHLARSEGHERYFGCNLMHRNVLASSHQHLMAEAPGVARGVEVSGQILHVLQGHVLAEYIRDLHHADE